ncbi:MAG: DNA-binding response regulator [Candidatus Pelagibacter sp. TMED273]|nr:MAG: DNA-binding response regulator [Candidatus Pelagibacter sp. TMED273]|tara:strand:+ start:648 stop:1325 length:678 start_codon:yes stop_codon:yes gene_type:complete
MKNNTFHILVVDDDNRIRALLKEYLSEKGYIISTSNSAENAKIKIDLLKFDLIILDVMMPGQNGYELTKEIKKKIKVPIILLTAKNEVENRIKGLELGADDYISKPFEPKELLLRIKNIINKNDKINLNIKHFVGKAEIDLNKMNINLGDKNKKINPSEKKVLAEMLSNPGKTFSREEIGKISGINQERSIDVMITRLRQKIENNPKNPKYLQTIRGSGYVLWIE